MAHGMTKGLAMYTIPYYVVLHKQIMLSCMAPKP